MKSVFLPRRFSEENRKRSPGRVALLQLAVVGILYALPGAASAARADDLLPSWNEGAAKSRLVQFVDETTTNGSPSFVEPAERIAVFDNDGTLWPENPLPFQLLFALDELKRLAPEHPEWQKDPTLKAALAGDMAAVAGGGKEALLKVVAASHAGMTTEEFQRRVTDWLAVARHPRFKRPYDQLGYQPMLELLSFLRDHGYSTYIVSGGGADFMRVWAEGAYGIAPQQVIGSIGPVRFELRDDRAVLLKEPGVAFIDDKEGKPVAIHRQIGRRPAAAFGNSDGDVAMLQYTTLGRTPTLGLIVHHTDADREYAYDAAPKSTGKLVVGLEQAAKLGWIVVDMRRDWKRVFREE
jgi:hypothetical protein